MRLAAITIFAVKSLRGRSCDSAAVEPWGLAGDRRYLVVDPQGRFITQRDCPTLATIEAMVDRDGLLLSADGRPALRVEGPGPAAEQVPVTIWRDSLMAQAVGGRADAWLQALLGRPCRLFYMVAPSEARPLNPAFGRPEDRVSFADGFPVLLTSTASLDDLNTRLAEPVGMERFRANLVVDGAAPWAEDGWRQLRIGPVLFEAATPCARCIVITTNQWTGTRHPGLEPVRTLQGFRRDPQGQVIFGQNLVPRSGGRVTVGDLVEVVA